MPIEILDFEKLKPIFEYVVKTYNMKLIGRSNNFELLYDKTI